MGQGLFVLLITLCTFNLAKAQVVKNLGGDHGASIFKQRAYLFIQENCEACESSLHQLRTCSLKIRSKMNLVILESEPWALNKIKSSEVQKIQFQSLNFMTFEEAKKIKVRGTPTYLIGQISELKPLSCQEIKKQLAALEEVDP